MQGAVIMIRTAPITHPSHMPRWITISHRIVIDVRIPVISLHPARDKRIRLRETSQRGIVPSGVVVHQPKLTDVGVLPGVGVLRGRSAAGVAHLSPGSVSQLGDHIAAGIGGQTRTAQMVGKQEIQRAIYPHRDSLCIRIVIFGDCTPGLLKVVADEVCRHAVDGLRYAVAAAIVGGDSSRYSEGHGL